MANDHSVEPGSARPVPVILDMSYAANRSELLDMVPESWGVGLLKHLSGAIGTSDEWFECSFTPIGMKNGQAVRIVEECRGRLRNGLGYHMVCWGPKSE